MKRIVLIWMAAFLMGGMAMAQHARHSDKMPEPKVRAERMTERMVKEYSLNDTLKQQLLEANLALVEKMGDMPIHRAKAHKHHKRDGKRHQLTDEQRAQKKAEMEKKREEDFANQEALRLSGVFNTPIPAQPPEREKALDKVKEPPRVCRSLEREER